MPLKQTTTYNLTAGAHLAYRNAAFRIIPTEQFAGSTARDIAKTIRALQRRGAGHTVNMTASPGNTLIGVLEHLAHTGTVPKEKILIKTPLTEDVLPVLFEEPISDNLLFKHNFKAALNDYVRRSGIPIEQLQNLIDMWYGCEKERINWAGVRYIHMAEYRGAAGTNTFSFASYLNRFFFGLMHPSNRIAEKNIVHIAQDQDAAWYGSKMSKIGGIDIAIVSIGDNGHVAFNEPGSPIDSRFRCVRLNPETVSIKDWDNPLLASDPFAYTLGIADLHEADHLYLLAAGRGKSRTVRKALFDVPSPEMPASLLVGHPSARIIIDLDAAEELPPSYQKLLTKACDNLHKARHLLFASAPLVARFDKTALTRAAETLASTYLDRVIDSAKTSELLDQFAQSGFLLPDFDAFMQNRILSFYVDQSSKLLSAVSDKDPKAGKKVEELFRRAFRVYRFPEAKDNILGRKRLIYNLIFINVMSSFMPTASKMRLAVAVSSTIDNALSSKDPAMFKPALELIFEILALDKRALFFNPFMIILEKSSHFPRFAKAIQDILLDAKDGKVALLHNDPTKGEVLSPEDYFASTKASVARIASMIPELKDELIDYLQALRTNEPERAALAQEIIELLGT